MSAGKHWRHLSSSLASDEDVDIQFVTLLDYSETRFIRQALDFTSPPPS